MPSPAARGPSPPPAPARGRPCRRAIYPVRASDTAWDGDRGASQADASKVGTGRAASTAGPTACRLRAVPSWLLQTLPTAFLSPDGDRWRDVPQEKGGKKHRAGNRCAAAGAAFPKSSGAFTQPSGRAPGPQVPPAGLPLPLAARQAPGAPRLPATACIDTLARFERGRLRNAAQLAPRLPRPNSAR